MPTKSVNPTDDEASRRFQQDLEARTAHAASLTAGGVTIVDPATTYIEAGIEIGSGSIIRPNTTISGDSAIGERCQIGPNAVIEDSRLDDEVMVGPFCHLRAGTRIESGVELGNFVAVKASRLGRGTKSHHFSYIGDADIGENVNIGAGTVTCNYDGQDKHRTVIEDGAFIGSDTMLVAPLRIGRGAVTGAGSVVTKDVAAGEQVAGVPAKRLNKSGSDG